MSALACTVNPTDEFNRIFFRRDQKTVDLYLTHLLAASELNKPPLITVIEASLRALNEPMFASPLMDVCTMDEHHDHLLVALTKTDLKHGTNFSAQFSAGVRVSNGDFFAFLFMEYNPAPDARFFNVFLFDPSYGLSDRTFRGIFLIGDTLSHEIL